MIKTAILGLASITALSLGTLTPALANYGHCIEQPDAADCRTYNMPNLPPPNTGPIVQKPVVHAHNHHYYAPQRG